jgi:hypothetical protein
MLRDQQRRGGQTGVTTTAISGNIYSFKPAGGNSVGQQSKNAQFAESDYNQHYGSASNATGFHGAYSFDGGKSMFGSNANEIRLDERISRL